MKATQCILGAAALAVVMASTSVHADPEKTRDQVIAELVAAKKNGDFRYGDDYLTDRERYPSHYPAVAVAGAPKTRDQVIAELVEAKKEGNFRYGDDDLTDRERFPQMYRTAEPAHEYARSTSAASTN